MYCSSFTFTSATAASPLSLVCTTGIANPRPFPQHTCLPQITPETQHELFGAYVMHINRIAAIPCTSRLNTIAKS
jgi:hypothetical protein